MLQGRGVGEEEEEEPWVLSEPWALRKDLRVGQQSVVGGGSLRSMGSQPASLPHYFHPAATHLSTGEQPAADSGWSVLVRAQASAEAGSVHEYSWRLPPSNSMNSMIWRVEQTVAAQVGPSMVAPPRSAWLGATL